MKKINAFNKAYRLKIIYDIALLNKCRLHLSPRKNKIIIFSIHFFDRDDRKHF